MVICDQYFNIILIIGLKLIISFMSVISNNNRRFKMCELAPTFWLLNIIIFIFHLKSYGLQCLMNSRWSSDGITWALIYAQRRLDQIIDYHEQCKAADRSRSMSMPLPIIEV